MFFFFFFQAEDGIRDKLVTGVQTCALPIWCRCAVPPSGCDFKNFVLWKSNKKVLQCQFISNEKEEIFPHRRKQRREKSLGDGALEEFAERLAESENFSEVVGSEIGAGGFSAGAFAADLYHANDAVARKNGGAHDFLDDLGALGGKFYAFEHAGVLHGGEIVDNFRAAFAGCPRGERGFAGERDETDIF